MATLPPQSTDGDGRLPWLDSGPVGDGPVGTGRSPPSRPSPVLRWISWLLILALVAVGAFLLGRRSELPSLADAPPPLTQPPLARPTLAKPPSASAPMPAPVPVVPVAPPVEAQTAPALARVQAELPRPRSTATPAPAPPPVLHLRPAQVLAVRQIARNSEVQAMRNVSPQVATRQAYSARGGLSGRVVQLGVYRSIAEAEASASAFRYKYRGLLEPLPKAVLSSRRTNDHRTFYRVQFVTPSQAYSEVTCQRLRAAGKSCIVIY